MPKPSRNLAWRDRFLTQIEEIVDESIDPDALASFPDMTTPIVLSGEWTQEQYTRILSSIEIGAALAYPEKRQQIYYDFLKLTNGAMPVSCDDVADCVEEQLAIDPETNTPVNQEFYNFITQAINQSGFGNPNHINPTQTTIADKTPVGFASEEIKDLPQCDLNKLWAGIRHGIVERLDEALEDALQDISAIPTIIGRNAAWLDIIPVLGDLAEAVVTSLSSVAPTLLSLFDAHSSDTTKDELACELFGLVCAQCRYPTHEEVYDHFKNYGMPATPDMAEWVLQTMTELLTNPVGVTAKVAYFTLMTWQLGILYVQGLFNGNNGSKALLDMATLGEDSANDNWLQLCSTCQEQYQWMQYDFTQGTFDWHLYPLGGTQPTNGKWVAGQGWTGTLVGTVPRVIISKNVNTGWVIRSIGFDYKVALPAPDLVASGITLRTAEGVNTGASNLNESTGTNYKRCVQGLAGSSGFGNIAMTLSGTGGQDVNDIVITKAYILYNRGQGEGTPIASLAQC